MFCHAKEIHNNMAFVCNTLKKRATIAGVELLHKIFVKQRWGDYSKQYVAHLFVYLHDIPVQKNRS